MTEKKYVEPQGWYTPGRGRIGDFDNLMVDTFTGVLTPMPSMTKQSEMAACDINNIVREFTITGQVQHISAKAEQGQYMNLPSSLDYQESMNTVIKAEEAFMSLPAKVRSRFENDPAQFLEFFLDPANQDEAIKMGLAKDTRPPEPPSPPAPPPEPPKPPKE